MYWSRATEGKNPGTSERDGGGGDPGTKRRAEFFDAFGRLLSQQSLDDLGILIPTGRKFWKGGGKGEGRGGEWSEEGRRTRIYRGRRAKDKEGIGEGKKKVVRGE